MLRNRRQYWRNPSNSIIYCQNDLLCDEYITFFRHALPFSAKTVRIFCISLPFSHHINESVLRCISIQYSLHETSLSRTSTGAPLVGFWCYGSNCPAVIDCATTHEQCSRVQFTRYWQHKRAVLYLLYERMHARSCLSTVVQHHYSGSHEWYIICWCVRACPLMRGANRCRRWPARV